MSSAPHHNKKRKTENGRETSPTDSYADGTLIPGQRDNRAASATAVAAATATATQSTFSPPAAAPTPPTAAAAAAATSAASATVPTMAMNASVLMFMTPVACEISAGTAAAIAAQHGISFLGAVPLASTAAFAAASAAAPAPTMPTMPVGRCHHTTVQPVVPMNREALGLAGGLHVPVSTDILSVEDQERLSRLQMDLAGYLKKYHELDGKRDGKQSDVEEWEKKREESREQANHFKEELQKAKREVAYQSERIHDLKQERDAVNGQLARLEQTIKNAQDDFGEIQRRANQQARARDLSVADRFTVQAAARDHLHSRGKSPLICSDLTCEFLHTLTKPELMDLLDHLDSRNFGWNPRCPSEVLDKRPGMERKMGGYSGISNLAKLVKMVDRVLNDTSDDE